MDGQWWMSRQMQKRFKERKMKGIEKAEVGEGKEKLIEGEEEVDGAEPCFLCQDV